MIFQKQFPFISWNYWIYCYLYNNRLLLRVKRNHAKHYKLLMAVSAPWVLLCWLFSWAWERTIGWRLVSKQIAKDNQRTFAHEVAIVAIAKNEGRYIEEWAEYHRLVGITKIYLYDNESTDNTRQLIQPYIDSGYVEYTFIPGVGKQLDAYADAIRRHKQECRYMAFIDLDEYLMPEKPFEQIGDFMRRTLARCRYAAGVGINWCLYGDSHHKTRVPGLITANFLHHAPTTNPMCAHVKTICNPRLVATYISPHYPIYRLGAVSLNSTGKRKQTLWFSPITFKEMRINHYYCKSEEDYKLKISRGKGDRAGSYDMKNFFKLNDNSIYDEAMLAYKPQLEEALQRKRNTQTHQL